MTDEPAFLRTIRDRSDNVDPRLVYADWLEEHGNTKPALLIRVLCQKAKADLQDLLSAPLVLASLTAVPPRICSAITTLLRQVPLGNLLTPEGEQRQYNIQVLLHHALGHLVFEKPPGPPRIGIDGIGGFHPLPTLDAIHAHLTTIEGIAPDDQLLLEPFALPLPTQFRRAEEWMLRHRQDLFQGELCAALEIDRWSCYIIADVSGTLVYNPVRFTRSHGGQTKRQIVEEQQQRNDPLEGWRVRVIPVSFRQIQPPYRGVYAQDAITPGHEAYIPPHQRLTPESYLQLWLSHFIATGQMLDSSDVDHTWTCLPGAYFPSSGDSSSGDVPYARWDTENRMMLFDSHGSGSARWGAGIRWSR